MKYLIAVDAIMRGHLSPTSAEYEGVFFWDGQRRRIRGDMFSGAILLTRNVAHAQYFNTYKKAEEAIVSQKVEKNLEFVMAIRKGPYVIKLSESELFKLALKYPNVNIGLD